jgi:hypothetical protein
MAETPVILEQPEEAEAIEGDSVTFQVEADGSEPLLYQWQRNGVDIPGATQADYTLAAVTLADNTATFRCIVSNGVGNQTSNETLLTVLPATSQAANSVLLPLVLR